MLGLHLNFQKRKVLMVLEDDEKLNAYATIFNNDEGN